MTVHYSIDTEDFIRFYKDHYKYSPEAKRSLRESRLWLGAGCLLWLLIGLFDKSPFFVYSAIALAVIFGVLIVPISLGFAKTRVKKLKKDVRNRALFGDVTMTIAPDGIYIKGDDSESTVKWNIIQDILLSPSHIYFYFSTINAVIVPNSAFASDAEREQCVETARRYREEAIGLVISHA